MESDPTSLRGLKQRYENDPKELEKKGINILDTKVSSFYHLCVECFSQLSFDSEVYTKSTTAADFVYTSESNESCEKKFDGKMLR